MISANKIVNKVRNNQIAKMISNNKKMVIMILIIMGIISIVLIYLVNRYAKNIPTPTMIQIPSEIYPRVRDLIYQQLGGTTQEQQQPVQQQQMVPQKQPVCYYLTQAQINKLMS